VENETNGSPSELLFFMSLSHASGNKWRNTSPRRPPTAKLKRVLRNFDSAAEKCSIKKIFN
jgi:hypothetical protein